MTTQLNTVGEAIDALEGPTAVSKLFSPPLVPHAVSQWKERGWFPPETFAVINEALKQKNLDAPLSLWRMRAGAAC